MAKQWIKQQVRHNELEDFISRQVRRASSNRRAVLTGLGGSALALVVLGVFLYGRAASQRDAWDRYSVAQIYAFAGHPETSLEHIRGLAAERPGTDAAGFAEVFAGDVLYRGGSYKEALAHYAKVLERGRPAVLVPIALANTAVCHEALGNHGEAIAADQRFLAEHSDHFLAPQVHASLARSLLASGKLDEARATFQKITLQYPDTSWAGWASRKLQGK